MKKILAFWAVCCLSYWASAQQTFPLFQHFSPQETRANAKNWAMVQDFYGILYFANNEGVLTYNGGSWGLIPTPNPVRSLALGANNQIFVGCKEDFGMIKPNENSVLEYTSFQEWLGKEKFSFNEIFSIVPETEKTYFISDHAIFEASNTEKPKITKHTLSDEISGVIIQENSILAYAMNTGLVTFQQGKLTPHSSKTFEKLGVYRSANLTPSRSLVATLNESLVWFEKGQGQPFITAVDAELKSSRIADVAVSKSGIIAVGTYSKGVLVLNPNGSLLYRIDVNNGLPDNDIYNVFFDNQENIWISHGKGISSFKLQVGVKKMMIDNLPKVSAIQYFEGKLYIGTTNGLFVYQTGLERVKHPIVSTDEIWALAEWNGHLFIGSNAGLFSFQNGKFNTLLTDKSVLHLDKINTDLWFAGENCAGKIKIDGSAVTAENYLTNIAVLANSIVQTPKGLWIGTDFRGLIKIEGSRAAFYTKENGLADGKVVVSEVNGEAVFQTQQGFYKYGKNTFDKIPAMQFPFTSAKFIKLGKHYHFFTNNGIRTLLVESLDKVNIDSSASVLEYFNHTPSALIEQANQYILATDHQLFILDKNKPALPTKATITISSITSKDQVLFNGVFSADHGFVRKQPANEYLHIDAKHNTFEIHLGLTDYSNINPNQYSYQINDEEWSSWSNDPIIRISKAFEGSYHLTVRVKNSWGDIVETPILNYTIQAPWYRTIWAYILYIFIALGLVWLIIRLNAKRLEEKNRKLEHIVEERTEEVKAKNTQLNESIIKMEELYQETVSQKNVIEEKNKDITDSINYAARIQKSLLQSSSLLQTKVDSFCVFKPRDVVSGDFYWFRLSDDYLYLGVVDCTGHGVPGALMSVIGMTTLNAIASDNDHVSTHEIVTQLNERITHILGQNDPSSTSKDGMDLSFIRLHLPSGVLEFTGANRPLYWVNQGVLEEIKGDKFPIGGGRVFEQKEFTTTTITLHKNDRFYLFSDGYPDQFGGIHGKKLTPKPIRELITANLSVPMRLQEEIFIKTFEDWKGTQEQTDDVLLMGIEFLG